ncbi:hypothetical protein, partial [Nocardioides marmoraquaticus]
MRRAARYVTAPALVLLLAAPAAPAAARPDDDGGRAPSAGEVQRAEEQVALTRGDVASIEAALADASARQGAADLAAAQAAEAYNGALWRLEQAEARVRRSAARAEAAAADVEQQRSGIVSLVTESYQNGTDLSAATALLTDDGFTGVMNRQAVVESAGESMDAAFQDFETARAAADAAAADAQQAETEQQQLADDAESQAAAAASAAQAAADATTQVAAERTRLIADLARAQQISVGLATERQEALEAAARRRAAAREAAAQQAAEDDRADD